MFWHTCYVIHLYKEAGGISLMGILDSIRPGTIILGLPFLKQYTLESVNSPDEVCVYKCTARKGGTSSSVLELAPSHMYRR